MLRRWFYRVVLMTAMAALGAGMASASEAPRIGKDEVKARLGAADTSIVDVRANSDWLLAEMKIKGAVRENPDDVDSWASRYPKDRTLILYCA